MAPHQTTGTGGPGGAVPSTESAPLPRSRARPRWDLRLLPQRPCEVLSALPRHAWRTRPCPPRVGAQAGAERHKPLSRASIKHPHYGETHLT